MLRTSSTAASWSTSEDLFAAVIAGAAGRRAGAVLPEDRHRPRAARRRRRPPGRAVGRHPAEPDLGHRLDGRRLRGAGRRRHLGQQARGAVLAVAGGAEGAAGGDPRRLHLGARRHHRRPDHRRRREALRGVPAPSAAFDLRRRHRDLVRLRAGAGVPAGPPAGPVRRTASSTASDATSHALPRERPVQDRLPADQQIFPIAQDRWFMLALAGRSPSVVVPLRRQRIPLPRAC